MRRSREAAPGSPPHAISASQPKASSPAESLQLTLYYTPTTSRISESFFLHVHWIFHRIIFLQTTIQILNSIVPKRDYAGRESTQ